MKSKKSKFFATDWSNLFSFLFLFLLAVCVSCHKDPIVEPDPDSEYDQVLTDDGIYLSIYAFNNGIVGKMDFTLLDENSAEYIKSWIRSLNSTQDATALLYTIDSALNALQRTRFPDNLYSVNMVNFTDGIDNASVEFSNQLWGTSYQNRLDYQPVIMNRLRYATYHGHNMNAYGIGVRSASIDEDVFRTTIEGISSSDMNAKVLTEISEVSNEFVNIANNITTYNTTTDVRFQLACSGSDRLAFVFDDAETPAASQCKIEATLNSNHTLTGISYTGLISSSEGTIQGIQVSGAIYSFTFANLKKNNNEVPATANVRLFKTSLGPNGNTFALDVEFNPASQTNTEVIKKTAAVTMVLDVSSSLGANFNGVKEAACRFVDNMVNPQTSPSEATAPIVQMTHLTATPTTVTAHATVNNGGSAITRRGFIYSTSANFSNPEIVEESGNFTWSSYQLIIAGLLPNTSYYVKAFAQNGIGISYSANSMNITTPSN